MSTTLPQGARRQLKTRDKIWARQLAVFIGRTGVTPNAISVISMVFAVLGAVCFVSIPNAPCNWGATLLWLAAAACIQLRLLCNLLDGMVAIEGGKKSRVGGLYNEVPDRIADALFLAAAGCTSPALHLWGVPLGWLAVALAFLTAYIRVLGGTLVQVQSFIGPMAKQHRMAALTLACLLSMAEIWIRNDGSRAGLVIHVALLLIVVGSAWTCVRRLRLIAGKLNEFSS